MPEQFESQLNDTNVKLFESTDKHFINDLPRFLYEGPISIVIDQKETEKAVSIIKKNSIVGIDTETRPCFHKGEKHKVALLQISTKDVCFLFRLNRISLPDCLIDLLSDEGVMKIGLSLKDDFLMLRKRKDFTPRGFVDLQNYIKDMGIKDMSLQKLFANVFHMRISKNERLSNWEADSLSERQQRYAATDAYSCILLFERLSELRKNGNYTIRAKDADL